VIVTIHQPEHLPWLGFFNKVDRANVLVLLDVVQYRKGYFQNRNRILGPDGPQWLSVPVVRAGYTQGTLRDLQINNAVRVHNRVDWRRRHWKTIEHAYRRHPYFALAESLLAELYRREWDLLVDLNVTIIRGFLDVLNVDTRVVWASDLHVEGRSSQLLASICRAIGARTYLSGPTGRAYLDEAPFRAMGIGVDYHEFEHPTYPQRHRDVFVPNMSTLDLLCNCGPDSLEVIRSGTPRATESDVAWPAGGGGRALRR
jgi:hypothetical protein